MLLILLRLSNGQPIFKRRIPQFRFFRKTLCDGSDTGGRPLSGQKGFAPRCVNRTDSRDSRHRRFLAARTMAPKQPLVLCCFRDYERTARGKLAPSFERRDNSPLTRRERFRGVSHYLVRDGAVELCLPEALFRVTGTFFLMLASFKRATLHSQKACWAFSPANLS
jgi:hypothetical protein